MFNTESQIDMINNMFNVFRKNLSIKKDKPKSSCLKRQKSRIFFSSVLSVHFI